MPATWVIFLIAFVMATSLVVVLGLLLGGRTERLEARLQSLSGQARPSLDEGYTKAISKVVETTLPKMGQSLIPGSEAERTLLQTRLIHAGLYGSQAMVIFLGAKLALMIAPAILGLIGGLFGLWPANYGLVFGGCASIFGMIMPSFWLDHRKSQRQLALRRSLPDAADLIVICMEGGLSLPGALRRVTGELRTAHPILASELNIVQREVQLGRPLPDALGAFSARTDLQELQSLAAVVKSAEQFGSSMVKALHNYSDGLRLQRQQHAEEMAQKAATKILFPTLLFIFPSILIIILGPAAIQIAEVISHMGK